MTDFAISRRAFLAASSSALAAVAMGPKPAHPDSHRLPSGPVYARVGRRGLDGGATDGRAAGEVILLDGRAMPVRNEHRCRVAPGKSVWLSPDEDGVFSVLYAEV